MKPFIYTIVFAFISFNLSSCVTRAYTKPAYKTATIVKISPKGHKIVLVKGKKYYKWNNKYYKKTKRGYVVVKL